MSRIAYVNGRYVPHGEAAVHVEDRGYQFADGVYEVVTVRDSRFVDEIGHLERLDRSLRELRIRPPMSRAALGSILRRVVRLNKVRDGIVYLQVTRGVAPREHAFPSEDTPPSVVVTARPLAWAKNEKAMKEGVKLISRPDIRWKRCDIKTVSLLANVLAKQEAKEQGGYEAMLIDDEGFVTEGSATNIWIVNSDGDLQTRHVDHGILTGITRLAIMALARENDVAVIERRFTPEEAKKAREVFITSASNFVLPVVQIDDKVIGNGKPGSIVTNLRSIYDRYMAGERREAAAGAIR